MFNILIRGEIDVKGLADQVRIIEDRDAETEAESIQMDEDIAAEINKYINVRAINSDSNSKIAEIEAYVVIESNDWGDTWSWINFRFVFGDGSAIDAETYFNEGFENFISEINSLITDLNNQYDDIDLDPIDYPIDF